jgi:hypothetical protein
VKLSDKSKRKIEKAKNAETRLKRYEKYYSKDSLKQARKFEKQLDARGDSLVNAFRKQQEVIERRSKAAKDGLNSKVYNTVYAPWAKKQSREQLQWLEKHNIRISENLKQVLLAHFEAYFLRASQNDSMLTSIKEKMPGVTLPKQLSAKVDDYKTLNPQKYFSSDGLAKGKLPAIPGGEKINDLQGKAGQYTGKMKEVNGYRDTLGDTEKAKLMASEKAEEAASGYSDGLEGVSALKKSTQSMDKLKEMPLEYKTKAEQMQDSAYRKEQARQKAEEFAMEYINQHPELTRGAQRKMSLLMKKYSIIPNSNDLSTATRHTSLKGRSFKERLYIASNFQVLSLEPVSIDWSPMIGYRFNKRFLAGIGGNYRQSFSDTIPAFSPDVLGYKVFSAYDIIKNFFAYGEFDRNTPGVNKTEQISQRIWKNAAFLGLGRKFPIHKKVEMTIVMMYNFLHERHDQIYPKPWCVRIGFQTSELAWFKPKPLF